MSGGIVLGTAGHIDHGKTALVQALTGVDTDRLKEEKERGITIDLGFARLDLGDGLWAGMVDVPGHEGFIRNMVAGVAGIDAVVLVVAADEGVMPQTREHLDIVELLGVESGVVVLTKADLVDPEWMELVLDDVRSSLAGRPLADAPILPTSVRTGQGLDTLRSALAELTRTLTGEGVPATGPFRMPVDRCFSVRGTGTVVTGTVWSGRIAAGDHVFVRPGGTRARIRGIEVHGRTHPEATRGQRTALALVGVDREEVPRGSQLVALADWTETQRVTARVRLLPGVSVERGRRVRVHLGTAEVMARVFPASDAGIAPGDPAWTELRLESPLLTRTGDAFVLRSYSPLTTIGGGRVGEAHPPRRKLGRTPRGILDDLLDPRPGVGMTAALTLAGDRGVERTLLPLRMSAPAPTDPAPEHAYVAGSRWILPQFVDALRERVEHEVRRYQTDHPVDPGVPVERLRTLGPADLVDRILEDAEKRGDLVTDRNAVHTPDFEPTLDSARQAVAASLRARYGASGLTPPRVEELEADVGGDAWSVVRFLERQGELLQIEDDLFVLRRHFDEAVERIRSTLSGQSDLGPADFRDALQVSRKYLLPILHRLDQDGVTVRQGDRRAVP